MYKKVAWVADFSLHMKWTMLKIIDPIKGIKIPGKMVVLQGVVFFIYFPNSDGIFGYIISIKEDTIQFLQVRNEGMAQNVLNTRVAHLPKFVRFTNFRTVLKS